MGAVVVAQLAEWSLLTPEIRGSNPSNDKFVFKHNYLSIGTRQRQIYRNRGQFIKKSYSNGFLSSSLFFCYPGSVTKDYKNP